MANWQDIAGIDCIVSEAAKPTNCVVLFHGYGADATDLAPLESFLDPGSNDTTWIFPQGPMEIIIGPGMTGRAWFEIDMQALEQAMVRGEYRDLTTAEPPGLEAVAEMAVEMLASLQQTFKNVIIGGFSQGAMLATEITLRAPVKPKALIVLSGALLQKVQWLEWAKVGLTDVPLFQSHGDNDALLDPKQAVQLFQLLKQAGMRGKMYQFKGGHEIPPAILAQLRSFLTTQLS
ncbi:MAG: serine esterase [Bdellovibrionales bacterium]|nr:serine esterase [Bdellovibrionales bacterium]